MINPARSCDEIKQRNPIAKSGYYWVHLKMKSVHVYCDMITDGGKC